ncbi:MAG: hypothetical protein V3R30_14500 [Kiloniellales bacterium]
MPPDRAPGAATGRLGINRRHILTAGAALAVVGAAVGGTAVPALAAAGDPDQAFVELVERHRETMQAWCRLGEAIDKAMKAIRVYAPRVQYGHRRSHGERTPLYAHTVDELKRAIGPWHQGLPAISAEDHRRRNARRNGLIAELHRRKTVYEANPTSLVEGQIRTILPVFAGGAVEKSQ